jgi:hypothetical protein
MILQGDCDEVANLKCCGNCKHFITSECPLREKIDDDQTEYPPPVYVCKHWEWDGWTNEARQNY